MVTESPWRRETVARAALNALWRMTPPSYRLDLEIGPANGQAVAFKEGTLHISEEVDLAALPGLIRDQWWEVLAYKAQARDRRGRFARTGGGGGLSDAAYAKHRAKAENLLRKADSGGGSTEAQYEHDPKRLGQYSPARARQHEKILAGYEAEQAGVPATRQAIIMTGISGSGKTTSLARMPGVEMEGGKIKNYAVVDPDHFKTVLARRGLVPKIHGLSPMEASSLAHEESSHLAKRAGKRMMAKGKNVIWDITGSSEKSVAARISDLKARGYKVTLGHVAVSVKTSRARVRQRHRRGVEAFLKGEGLGERVVPDSVIKDAEGPDGRNTRIDVFKNVRRKADRSFLIDNEQGAAVLVPSNKIASFIL